jgi:hypothetical protein
MGVATLRQGFDRLSHRPPLHDPLPTCPKQPYPAFGHPPQICDLGRERPPPTLPHPEDHPDEGGAWAGTRPAPTRPPPNLPHPFLWMGEGIYGRTPGFDRLNHRPPLQGSMQDGAGHAVPLQS